MQTLFPDGTVLQERLKDFRQRCAAHENRRRSR
jgi:hypothetical protein